jgi:LPXTG-site transpeptidase (sortase) family protein
VIHAKKKNALSLIFITAGIFLLLQVSWPLLSYKIWEFKFIQDSALLISPVGNISGEVLGVSIEKTSDNFLAFVSNVQRPTKAPYESFQISVPALKIKEAVVSVDKNELNYSLGHLPGSALPGEKGNVFISGHSALPIFFKGDKNYGSIFANLPNLKKGDLIQVKAGESYLNYIVQGFKIVNPNDLSVIMPPDSRERYISLMTCVPPGLNTKRLVVLGKLQ